MGVSILPKLAANVCMAIKGTTKVSCRARRSTAMAKGTKVIKDTSLVMTMLQKKGKNTSTAIMDRVVAVRCSRLAGHIFKQPLLLKALHHSHQGKQQGQGVPVDIRQVAPAGQHKERRNHRQEDRYGKHHFPPGESP